MLGAVSSGGFAVAVTGTHGKTTTSAGLAFVLSETGKDPTALIGGHIPQFGGSNIRLGESDCVVMEADESDGSFTHLNPSAILLTNVEAEHMDHHGSMEQLLETYQAFLGKISADQALVFCSDDEHAARLSEGLACRSISYGIDSGDYRVTGSTRTTGGMEVEIGWKGNKTRFVARLQGRHNALNLAGIFAMAMDMGLEEREVVEALSRFEGVARRQQYLGKLGDCLLFDDYAHHPTEIRATLSMFRERYESPITVVFQPHLYSRTAYFQEAFADALRLADRVFLAEIYGSREAPVDGVSSELILKHLNGHGNVFRLQNWRDMDTWFKPDMVQEGVLITMGAGDITELGPMLLNRWGKI